MISILLRTCFVRCNHHHYLSQTIFEPKLNYFLPNKFSPIQCTTTYFPTTYNMCTRNAWNVLKENKNKHSSLFCSLSENPNIYLYFYWQPKNWCFLWILACKVMFNTASYRYHVISHPFHQKYFIHILLYFQYYYFEKYFEWFKILQSQHWVSIILLF
jgi:hypothetical protein